MSMSCEMKNAWIVLTISMEMYSEIGTMFWKAIRHELYGKLIKRV